jgi:MFS family permease
LAHESRLDRAGLSALEYGAFRLFFGSMLVSTSGNFMYFAALGWYVLEVTGSAALVGIVFTATGLPVLLMSAYAGVLTDRLGARVMLLLSFGAMLGLAAPQAVWAAAGVTSFPLIALLALGFGVAQTIGAPASVAIVTELVPAPAVSSATALNFLHMNAARIVGGLLGGALLAATSPAFTFVVAALLFGAPIVAMTRLRLERIDGGEDRSRAAVIGPLLEAVRYAAAYPTLGVLMLMTVAPGAIGLAYQFMLPVAADELGIGAGGLGILMAAAGVGGLIAGVSLESVQRRIGHGRAVFAGIIGASIGLIGFGIAPTVPLAIASLLLVGMAFLTYGAASVTLTQALSPARMRGRMVSLFATLYWGMMPVGAFIVGIVAELTTARVALLLCGVGLAASALVAYVRRPQIATLAVARDGRTVSGDLEGSGEEPPAPAASTVSAEPTAPSGPAAPDSPRPSEAFPAPD